MKFNQEELSRFPTKPGVYLMKNGSGTVIYVGKAKNLRQRVKQYFASGGDGRAMVPFLVPQVASIETLVVHSEKEALLLECNLIKEYKPKYNALLKDDKSYIALKVNNKHPWPSVQLVRYRGKPKPDGLYFGPYTNAYGARQTLDLIQKLFPLRQCSDQELARRTRPCILFDMKRCIAPCVGKCTKEEYGGFVTKTVRFLRGHDKDVLKDLYKEMEAFSSSLEFERAGAVLKTIQQLEKTIEGQTVDKPLGKDTDVLGIYRKGDEVILSLLIMRQGRLLGQRHYNFTKIAEDDPSLLRAFLLQHYESMTELPHEILLPVLVPESPLIEELLSSDKSRKVHLFTPQKGEKRALIKMAEANAEATFKKEKDEGTLREKVLLEIQEKFHLNKFPKRIECFDNSNLAGSEPVSAMVTFIMGKKEPSLIRKFKIKPTGAPDDYGAMYEVLTRRYKRGKEEGDLPDLVIIDGGKGHLNVALRVMKELNIITVDLISVVKEEGRHDKGLTAEQVYLPNIKDPIQLGRTSSILYFLQQVRDEAHRVAITFHRKRRSKNLVKSSLEEISGIGPSKRKELLKAFGSIQNIKNSSADQILAVPGIGPKDLENLQSYFMNN